MNKKTAIAYAQITLEYMLSSKYKGELNIETFEKEMRESFKIYSQNTVLEIAKAKIFSMRKYKDVIKNKKHS